MIEAREKKVEDIITKHYLEIPFFQRSYVWEEKHLERFLDDMEEVSKNDKNYFLGSIILKEKENSKDSKIIIDGQQRLTTIAIFYQSLRSILKKDVDLFILPSGEFKIEHNHFDKPAFEAVLKGEKDIEKKYSGSKIIECYKFFRKQENIERLKKIDYKKIWKHIYVVEIILKKEDDEQKIFDTINTTGKPLSTAELLKNYLFPNSEHKALFDKTWSITFEDKDKEYWSSKIATRENIDLLLQSFLTIETKGEEKYLGISSISNNYKIFLNEKGNDFKNKHFIPKLMKAAKSYRENIDQKFINENVISSTDEKITSSIRRINIIIFELPATTIVPYLLYIIKNVKDKEEQNNMIRLLENYLIRRLVCQESTKNYNKLFASCIRDNIANYNNLSNKLLNSAESGKFPSVDDFLTGIKGNKLKDIKGNKLKNAHAQIFLYLLETSIRDKNSKKESTRILGFKEYSLEHIMPKKWRKNEWPKTDDEDNRNALLLTLGNLTILTSPLNKSMKNSPWETKKEKLIEYSKDINIINKEKFLEKGQWDEKVIDDRAKFLATEALNAWPDPTNNKK